MSDIPSGEDYYKGRRDSVAELYDALDDAGENDDAYDDAQRQLDEYPLSVEDKPHVVVVLGTGGPHDEIDYNIATGQATYFYVWGSESFRRTLSSQDPLYRLAEYYAEIHES